MSAIDHAMLGDPTLPTGRRQREAHTLTATTQDTVSVGAVQSVIEDYEALDIRLERAEE